MPAKIVVVKKQGPNKGRQFYACSKPQVEQCDFFEWADAQKQAQPTPKADYYAKKQEPNWDKIRKESHENMELLNAKNNATLLLVEAMRGGMTLADALTNFDATTQEIYDIGRADKPK